METSRMVSRITVSVDREVADLYTQAPPEVRRKMELLFSLLARDFLLSPRPLTVIMDEIAEKATERGVTPEIVEALLHDK